MSRIRLGGIKVFENRAYFSSVCRDADALGDLCSVLAANRLNMGLVTHLAAIGTGESVTAACARSAASFERLIHPNGARSECIGKILAGACRISVFPHDKRPGIAAALIGALAEGGVEPHCFGSSPSAITIVVSSSSFQTSMERIFEAFSFPSCKSYPEWQASCRVEETLLQEVRCAYHEEVIHVYDFNHLNSLDLWNVTLPLDGIWDFGNALFELDALQLRMPFLVSNSSPREGWMIYSFCLASEYREKVKQIFHEKMPDRDFSRLGPVSALFLHGPHFGDRYGIANALVTCLRNAGITPLAISCAVSSISLVVESKDEDRTAKALSSTFQTPGRG